MKPINYGPENRMRHLVILGLLLTSTLATAESYTGRVVAVADGDTVTVLDNAYTQHKVRLAGIDAPEKKQAFGQVSKQHLSNLVFDKTVTIETTKRDRYQREIGKVLVNGRDANLSQVEAGLAWHYKRYAKEQAPMEQQSYAVAEVLAKQGRKGLWQDANPVPPWDFRHQKKGQ